MKPFLLLVFLGSLSLSVFGQDTKFVTVNTLEDNGDLYKSAYQFPAFLPGRVIFKDEATADAKLNYHRLLGQMLFISPTGDTLALAHPETIAKVAIGTDTFYYFRNAFLLQLSHNPGAPNLFQLQSVKYLGNEKKGAYGTYSGVSAANSNTTFTPDDQTTKYIPVDENMVYKANTEYYVSDRFNNFFPANKSRIYGLFSSQEKALKEFADANHIDFKKKADLLRLLQYALGL